MYKNLVRISTKGMSHKKWLEERKNAIGGSDAAAVIGVNKYSSPYYVWCDKLGVIPPKEETEAMRQGTDLEEYVAERFTRETGKKVRKCNAIIYNPDYPFAHANVDRLVVGEDAGLECKTTSQMNLTTFKNGEYPANFYVQCMHYMMCTGAKKWYLAVLVYSSGFFVFEINRDEDEIKALAEAEEHFWNNYVVKEEPPEPDYKAATSDALNYVYEPDGTEVYAKSDIDAEIDRLNDLKEQKSELDKEIKAAENKIKNYMGDAETLKGTNLICTWKVQKRSTYDFKRIFEENPQLDAEKYKKTSESRVFRMKVNKGDK